MNIPNIMHSTQGAQQFGYKAALVGGTTVYGWAVPAVLQVFGSEWLHNGWHDVTFRKPVFPGDEITTSVTERDDGAADLVMVNQDGGSCVMGTVGVDDAPWLDELRMPQRLTPEPKLDRVPDLTLQDAPVGQDLRPLAEAISKEEAERFAREEERDTDPLWAGERPRLHPGWIAFRVWPFIRHSVHMGPILHTRSQIQHVAPAFAGQTITTAGHFVEAYERKGHHYCLVDGVALSEDGQALARFRHTTIFKIAARA